MICSFMVYASLESAGNCWRYCALVDFSVDKAQEILDLPPMDIDGRDIVPEKFDIDVENITFSYDKCKIIDNVTVHIPERTTTAIVGPRRQRKNDTLPFDFPLLGWIPAQCDLAGIM